MILTMMMTMTMICLHKLEQIVRRTSHILINYDDDDFDYDDDSYDNHDDNDYDDNDDNKDGDDDDANDTSHMLV